MLSNYKKIGFTLVELMMVVVIIGILSIVAIPSYRKYIADSKISEGYANLDAIIKKELAYFNDTAEFYLLTANPALVASNMTIETNSYWADFNYPIAVGSNVYFSYSTRAGKIDSTGTELAAGPVTGAPFSLTSDDDATGASTASGACNRDGATAVDMGVTPSNGLDWLIVRAHADLDGTNADEKCTAIIRVIKTNPATNEGPSSGGFIVINKGS
jgi:prepilin-type N-terminal cleavage/methylation domain-containing protein